MKIKDLRLKRAVLSVLFTLLLSVAGVTNVFAQTQVATLKHGDQISAFYGATALSEAHEAAEAGDVITLSSGAFTLDTITKAITLHGAGFVTDTISGTAPTIINSDITANVPNGSVSLTIEGILFSRTFMVENLLNPHFIKCYFNGFGTGGYTLLMSQSQFVNCRFASISIEQSTNSSFVNSVIWSITRSGSGMEAYNSIIKLGSINLTMSVFNCIVVNGGATNIWLSGESVAFNCVGDGAGATYVFRYAFNENCWCIAHNGFDSLMENYTGNQLTEPFVLTEEAANTYIGTDGTQIGIHGGPYPYTDHPYYMTIKHCTVGSRTTDDGHLSVDIEVVTEQ